MTERSEREQRLDPTGVAAVPPPSTSPPAPPPARSWHRFDGERWTGVSGPAPGTLSTGEYERLRDEFMKAVAQPDHITVLPPDPMEVMIRESAATYGQAFIYRDPSTGEEQVLDPQHVTIVKPMPVEPSLPELDLDWHGDAFDEPIDATGHVLSFRRFGPLVNFGIIPGAVTVLTAHQAEDLAANLYAAARAARKAAST